MLRPAALLEGGLDDTVVAPATHPGPAAAAVVRLAGPRALALARAVVPDLPARGGARAPVTLTLAGWPPVRATALVFRAPRSSTGDDQVELWLPGVPPLVDATLAALAAAGARPARPGELTRRAYLRGKLDASQVGAVLALTTAEAASAARAAARVLTGGAPPASAPGHAAAGGDATAGGGASAEGADVSGPARAVVEGGALPAPGAGASRAPASPDRAPSGPGPSAGAARPRAPEALLLAARADLLGRLAELEAAIDFPDEGLDLPPTDAIAAGLDRARALVADAGRALARAPGPRGAVVALAGPANAGKSSLLNALVGREAALVFDAPGTTRDPVEAAWSPAPGLAVTLVDLAGELERGDQPPALAAAPADARPAVQATSGPHAALDRAAALAGRARLAEADLALVVVPAARADLAPAWLAWARSLRAAAGHGPGEADRLAGDTAVRDAAPDSDAHTDRAGVLLVLAQADRPDARPTPPGLAAHRTSVRTGEGLPALAAAVAEHLGGDAGRASAGGDGLARARRDDALARAEAALHAAVEALRGDDPARLELAAGEVALALDALGLLVQAATTDELLGRLFAGFCVGK